MTDGRLTQQQFDRQLWRAIIPPLLLLAGHAAIISILIIYWLRTSDRLQQGTQIISRVNELEMLLFNMETGVRGHLLTGHEEFLAPYTRARERITPALQELRQSVGKEPAHVRSVDAADRLYRQWMDLEPAMRGGAATQPSDADLAAVLARRRDLIEEVRSSLREIADAENQLQQGHLRREQWAAVTTIAGSIGVSILVGIGLAMINRRTVMDLSRVYHGALDDQARSSRELMESQKQIERERESMLAAERTARSNLLRANQVKDQFLATLSHELRTPMSAILGWARLLRDPVIRTQKLNRALEAIDANAKAQARLIDDLLDMTRIVSGKLTINAELIDLRKIARAAVDAVAPAAQEKGIRLAINIDEREPINAFADPARIQQIVWNLLSNAIKFTPGGGTVNFSLRGDEKGSRIMVSDTGRGISPEFLPYVFDRFRQEDGSTTRRQGGLGLGLAIVKHLVELHRGTVLANSEGEGKGASFTITLPPPGPNAGQPHASLTVATDWSVLTGRRILIVDDDRNTASVTQTVLERAGAIAESVYSARQAMDLIHTRQYDALISDIAMPDMDGYAMIRQVRLSKTPNQLPAIALTGFARPDDRDAALRAGYNSHLAQPVAPDRLLKELVNLLASPGESGTA
jgi:signal transduction histidine kinase/CheY-like chemotaxis protein